MNDMVPLQHEFSLHSKDAQKQLAWTSPEGWYTLVIFYEIFVTLSNATFITSVTLQQFLRNFDAIFAAISQT